MSVVPPPLPQRDWAQRNRLWLLPLLAVLCLVVPLAIVGGVFSMIMKDMKSHPAYVEAVTRARNDPQVAAALGRPIETGMFVMGSVSGKDQGHAYLEIPLVGAKAEAKLTVAALNEGKGWEYATMLVRLADGREISLIPTTAPALGESSGPPGCDRPASDADDSGPSGDADDA